MLVTSSATAYGAFPDNPKPIAEDWPVRGQPDFSYARDKAEADRLCQLWALEHPDRVMTIVRPVHRLRAERRQLHLADAGRTRRFMPILDGVDEEFQLVHEDDVVSAIIGLLDAKAGGAFNVAGDGTLTWGESAEMIGLKTREMSMKPTRRIYAARLGAPRAAGRVAAGQPELHPLSVGGLEREAEGGDRLAAVGHTREVFVETMYAKGLVATPPVPSRPRRPSPELSVRAGRQAVGIRPRMLRSMNGFTELNIAGRVATPDDSDWDSARAAWNLTADQNPVAVAFAESADDVAGSWASRRRRA